MPDATSTQRRYRVEYRIEPRAPFRLDLTVWALRRKPANVIDRWDGRTYRRALAWAGGVAEVAVSQEGPANMPGLVVAASGQGAPPAAGFVEQSLERLLGTRIDLAGFYRLAKGDARLGPLVERFRGMKPPRFPTVFETIVNGIACQQLSLASGIAVLGRLTLNCGPSVGEAGEAHAFPRPADIAGCSRDDLRALGFSRQKARAVIELASTAGGEPDLEHLDPLTDDEAVRILTGLRGVGRWTAEYVLLRGLGRLHVFPGDDVGMRNRLKEWLALSGPLDNEATRAALERWAPYAGLVYLHLLLRGLEAEGRIK